MHKEYKEKILEKAKGSFLSFFINNTRIAYFVVIGLIFGGLSAAYVIPKEDAPEIDYGIVVVNTFYNGASATDIDLLVTQEIENKIKAVDGINKMNSTSRDSFSSIVLEFDPKVNMVKAVGELRSKIDEAKSKLPSGAEDPDLQEINSNESLFNLHLSSQAHPVLLRDYAEKLKSRLEKLDFIEDVSISGGAEREIYIDLDPVKLNEFGISSMQVVDAIRKSNNDFPVGDLNIGRLSYDLRIQGRYMSSVEVKDVIVASKKSNKGSSSVKVSDLGEVYESQKEDESLEYLTIKDQGERLNTVRLQVKKTDSEDIFKIDPIMREVIDKYAKDNFGDNVQLNYTMQRVDMIKKSYDNVLRSGIQSVSIVILLLLFFLGIKESFIAGLVIPLTFLTTIFSLRFLDSSLNFMTNFSMILALGILVDTAIVIVEGIHESIKKGFSIKQSALLSLHEFKAPLISGTLTTLAVFIPLLTLPGILGKYLSFIPITVSITLVASLFISLMIIPAISIKFFEKRFDCPPLEASSTMGDDRQSKESKCGKIKALAIDFRRWVEKWQDYFHIKYSNFIKSYLSYRKMRIGIISGVIALFIFSMYIPVRFVMFPPDDFDYLFVDITSAPGVQTIDTDKISKEIEDIISLEPEVKYITSSVQDNKSSIFVELIEKDLRKEYGMRTNMDLSDYFQDLFYPYTQYEVRVKKMQRGPPSDSPVAFKVIAEDQSKLQLAQKVVKDFKEILSNIPGSYGVDDDLENTPGEIRFVINREKSLALGVDPEMVAPTLTSAIKGIEATTITRGAREVKVMVRYNQSKIKNFDDVGNIQVASRSGNFVSLSQILDSSLYPGLTNIKRSEGEIAITVSSDLSKDGNALEVTNKFKDAVKDYSFPDGVTFIDSGENMENAELFQALAIGFVSAIFLIFAILVFQFDSYKYPFIILFTIIMSQLGVNIGLFLTDTFRSLAFIIGVISLSGIVVNDAIILVDRINNLRKLNPNEPLVSILASAGESRLQPIILTTLTTAAGILPLMWVDTFWAGLSITVIFGLSVASSLTLFVTPVLYYQFEHESKLTFISVICTIFGVFGVIFLFSNPLKGLGLLTVAYVFYRWMILAKN